MKILHLGQMIGGLDVYIRNSIVYNNAGNEYVIVHGDKDGSKPVSKGGKSVKEYTVSLYRNLNPFNDLKALLQVIRIIRREKPDIIHCHSAKGGVIGRVSGWLTLTRTLYTPHAFSFLCSPSKLKRRIYLLIERITRFNAYVLACSESEQKMAVELAKYAPSHALLWHNSVPDASLEKGEKVSVNEPYACYIGRPCYQKNTLFLLEVIKTLRDRGCNLKFLLLGVGYHSPELEAMKAKISQLGLENNITLVPWLSHADCQEYVRGSLFYVTTSLYEGLPLSVIEAMANGKVIIASDVVGNRDCVEDGVNGWLLPLDASVFADRIIQLTADPALRKAMEEKSRQLFLDRFFIEKQIEELQEAYEACSLVQKQIE